MAFKHKDTAIQWLKKGYYFGSKNFDNFRNNKEVVLEAVKVYGFSLKIASDEMKDNKDVVIEAVKQHGWSLEFASDKLKADKDVVLEAVKQNSFALKFIGNSLREEIGEDDPIQYLEAFLLKQNLACELSKKKQPVEKTIIKL
jgi:hypothetical protein